MKTTILVVEAEVVAVVLHGGIVCAVVLFEPEAGDRKKYLGRSEDRPPKTSIKTDDGARSAVVLPLSPVHGTRKSPVNNSAVLID